MTTWGSRLGACIVLFTLGAAPMAACGDSGGSTTTDTATTTDTVATDTQQAADTLSGDTGVADTGLAADTAVAGVPFDDPHAIFAAKCTPCHTGGGSGGHDMGAADLAAAFADSQKDPSIPKCDGLTKGGCTIVRILAGDMPKGKGCTGDPTQDSGNAACLTQAEQDTIQAWIDNGQLGPAN